MSDYPTVWAYEQACAALHRTKAERDRYRDALTELLSVLDARYPKGQSKRLPGLMLFAAMERAREAAAFDAAAAATATASAPGERKQ